MTEKITRNEFEDFNNVFEHLDDAEPREAQVHCASCGCDLHDGVCPEGCAQLDEDGNRT